MQSAAQPQQELQSKDAAVDVLPSLPLEVQVQSGQVSSSAGNVEMDDPELAVPVTPPREIVMVGSPRSSPATQRVEDAKKQRINQMRMDYEKRLSAVKIEYKEYFTMDAYETELDVDKEMEDEDEIWTGEESVEQHFFFGRRPLPFGGSPLEPYSRTSGESNHHRQSVSDTRVPRYQLSREDT